MKMESKINTNQNNNNTRTYALQMGLFVLKLISMTPLVSRYSFKQNPGIMLLILFFELCISIALLSFSSKVLKLIKTDIQKNNVKKIFAYFGIVLGVVGILSAVTSLIGIGFINMFSLLMRGGL